MELGRGAVGVSSPFTQTRERASTAANSAPYRVAIEVQRLTEGAGVELVDPTARGLARGGEQPDLDRAQPSPPSGFWARRVPASGGGLVGIVEGGELGLERE